MSFTKEDLKKAKVIISKNYPNQQIDPKSLGLLGIELSEMGIMENGKSFEPSHSAVKRLLRVLGYEEKIL